MILKRIYFERKQKFVSKKIETNFKKIYLKRKAL